MFACTTWAEEVIRVEVNSRRRRLEHIWKAAARSKRRQAAGGRGVGAGVGGGRAQIYSGGLQ